MKEIKINVNVFKKAGMFMAGFSLFQCLRIALTASSFALNRFAIPRRNVDIFITKIHNAMEVAIFLGILIMTLYILLVPRKYARFNSLVSIGTNWLVCLLFFVILYAYAGNGKMGDLTTYYWGLVFSGFAMGMNQSIAMAVSVENISYFAGAIPFAGVQVSLYHIIFLYCNKTRRGYDINYWILVYQIIIAIVISGAAAILWTIGFLEDHMLEPAPPKSGPKELEVRSVPAYGVREESSDGKADQKPQPAKRNVVSSEEKTLMALTRLRPEEGEGQHVDEGERTDCLGEDEQLVRVAERIYEEDCKLRRGKEIGGRDANGNQVWGKVVLGNSKCKMKQEKLECWKKLSTTLGFGHSKLKSKMTRTTRVKSREEEEDDWLADLGEKDLGGAKHVTVKDDEGLDRERVKDYRSKIKCPQGELPVHVMDMTTDVRCDDKGCKKKHVIAMCYETHDLKTVDFSRQKPATVIDLESEVREEDIISPEEADRITGRRRDKKREPRIQVIQGAGNEGSGFRALMRQDTKVTCKQGEIIVPAEDKTPQVKCDEAGCRKVEEIARCYERQHYYHPDSERMKPNTIFFKETALKGDAKAGGEHPHGTSSGHDKSTLTETTRKQSGLDQNRGHQNVREKDGTDRNMGETDGTHQNVTDKDGRERKGSYKGNPELKPIREGNGDNESGRTMNEYDIEAGEKVHLGKKGLRQLLKRSTTMFKHPALRKRGMLSEAAEFFVALGNAASPVLMSSVAMGLVYLVFPAIAPYRLTNLVTAHKIDIAILMTFVAPALINIALCAFKVGPDCDWAENTHWHYTWLFAIPYVLCIVLFFVPIHYPDVWFSKLMTRSTCVLTFVCFIFALSHAVLKTVGFTGAGVQNTCKRRRGQSSFGSDELMVIGSTSESLLHACEADGGKGDRARNGQVSSFNILVSYFFLVFFAFLGDGYIKTVKVYERNRELWPTANMAFFRSIVFWVGRAFRRGFRSLGEVFTGNIREQLMS